MEEWNDTHCGPFPLDLAFGAVKMPQNLVDKGGKNIQIIRGGKKWK